jgi:hypothetical protein
MTTLQSFLALASTLVGLLTAWVGYRIAVGKTLQLARRTSKVTKLEDFSVRTQHWNVRRWRFIVIAVTSTYVGFIWVVSREASVTLVAAISVGIGNLVWLFVRTAPPSRVCKRANLELHLESSKVFQRCIEAMSTIGADIAKADAESEPKTIMARTRVTWRSFGDVLSVSVLTVGPDLTQIRLEVDSISPSVVFDFGSTARNLRRLKSELLVSVSEQTAV